MTAFLGPFPIAAAIERLRAQVPALRLVGSAADLATALASKPNASPCAYVLTDERSNEPLSTFTGLQEQDCIVTLQVVIFARNYASAASGSGARGEMDALIASVRTALLGWVPAAPADCFTPLHHIASRDESYDGGWLVAQEIFKTRYPLTVHF